MPTIPCGGSNRCPWPAARARPGWEGFMLDLTDRRTRMVKTQIARRGAASGPKALAGSRFDVRCEVGLVRYLTRPGGSAGAPRRRACGRGAGQEQLLQAFGAREIASGALVLTANDPTAWLWTRVAGDVLDAMLLSAGMRAPRQRRSDRSGVNAPHFLMSPGWWRAGGYPRAGSATAPAASSAPS